MSMNKSYANMCVLSTFGVTKEVFSKAIEEITRDNVEIKFIEKCLAGKIIIAKNDVDSIALQNVLTKLYNAFGNYIYADYDIGINERLVQILKERGEMISVAESITGGMISSKICEVNGASDVFYEGLITYNSAAKVRRLHVPAGVIELETAVSEPVCKAMLNGVLSNKVITYALATTGYASDMSEMNGLAYVGYGSKSEQHVEQVKFAGTRNEIREKVANFALYSLLQILLAKGDRY